MVRPWRSWRFGRGAVRGDYAGVVGLRYKRGFIGGVGRFVGGH
jgi:hypothetical protein